MKKVDISVSKRWINPQKIAVKQGEAATTILTFQLDEYKIDETDLRNYKAYAVTSINGLVDQIELSKENTAGGIKLTWVIDEQTLRYAGVITYQIVFKNDEGTSVFNTYEAVIQCSESIDGDHPITAAYPTILSQHFNLIQTLSGSFGAEIVYMPVGGSIPIEERLDGRLYYQWLETPTTRAACATGTVSLGDRPYADSGLYINNVHVFVDDTSETAYVIEAETWVNAINNARCGVTATDVSGSDGIKLMIVANTAGAVGNNITLRLDIAQYGEGAGRSNPSGGQVSGRTLTGGSDATTGVEGASGQFEDSNGNVLVNLLAKYIANGDLNEILDAGEYILAGGSIENAPSALNSDYNRYCVLRVVDSLSTNRILQECYFVNLTDNTVRTFTRAISIGDGKFGEWSEIGGNVGEVSYFANNETPMGWLLCDGSAVSRTKYRRLFNAIGTTWGVGDTSTTFNLPNLIDRVPWGATTAGSYIEAGLPDHNHDIGFYNLDGSAWGEKDISTSYKTSGFGSAPLTAKSTYTSPASVSNGVYGKSNTVQPPAAKLRPCIKY